MVKRIFERVVAALIGQFLLIVIALVVGCAVLVGLSRTMGFSASNHPAPFSDKMPARH